MLKLIKGILYRMVTSKAYLITPLVITPIVIAAAIYFSSSMITKANIGVVGADNINLKSNEINMIRLKEDVPLSDLVKNKYDAVLTFNNGKVAVDTIKDNNFKEKLEKLLNGEQVVIKEGEKRGVAANIVGFLTMFVLALGVMLYKFFFNDKKGISNRVISSNITYEQYVASHFASVFVMIFIPTLTVTILAKLLLNLDTAVTAIELAFIVFILSLLAAAYGLLISSIVKDEESASMLGIMLNITTTLIAGSFFTISNNSLISAIGKLFPQRHILNFTMSLENGKGLNYISLSNVLIVSLMMICLSFLITRFKMRRYN
ncbi:ABC transporter permease [Clostridium sp. YIM B02505]|uniref:ABC transporter permease n=1 Tax=Clostridium yunnanense TaxID=2800325 RepID=A0ABS1EKA4_9CLOT|nr:ABC transporter permease [Clostridium yunnanense]MBK1809787.1 ABC transporter permease [Clostridium yunnanense]